ncbi:Glutathione S-transferase [Roseicitreum antarcticum]|uniref:Glutathione S-transferase n=1 Tax=Roseicitreum antarcticum TaxID=564137 RepID=A0A1H2QV02_9RHOB|nr:Glutathione S-transferase [Roseicitreum antarcticum]
MSLLTLYHSPTSPFVRKCVVVLHETGQLADVTLSPAAGTPIDPGTMPLSHNPLGKIPALERPDGCTLFDSRVICRFLNDRGAGVLYPTGQRGWEALTLEAMADGITDAAILMVYETRARPEDKRFDGWVNGQWAKVERSLDALESRWIAYLAGPLCIGHIALACTLGYLDFRHAERDWRRGRPALAAWEARFAARAAMQATMPA